MTEPTEKPLLSICIPTYSRSLQLRSTLESIKQQVFTDDYLNDLVEIIVSDNASIDGTSEVVKTFKKYFSHITYIKNHENIGFDRNVINAVKHANGKYCWYLGDDDLVLNGSIARICSILATDKYDFLGLGTQPYKPNVNYSLLANHSFGEYRETNSADECFFKSYCPGILSVLIFPRMAWIETLDENNFTEHWLYYENVLRIIGKSQRKFAYLPDGVIVSGQDCRWAEQGTEFFTYINSIIIQRKMKNWGFDKHRLEKQIATSSKSLILVLLRAKSRGLPLKIKNLTYMLANMKDAGLFRVVIASMIFFIPNNIILKIRLFKKYSNSLVFR